MNGMTYEEACEMLALLDAGEPLSSTAAQFGLTPGEAKEVLDHYGLER